MKYKIYIVENINHDYSGFPVKFTEADFNWGCGCDTIEEAMDLIKSRGDQYINYTILPYILYALI